MDVQMFPATDQDLKDKYVQGERGFPIQYYVDELEKYPGRQIALHWHPELEFYVVRGCPLKVQLGQNFIVLQEGEGIFLNANFLHAYYPATKGCSTHPNFVFSPELIAPYGSTTFAKYIQPITEDKEIPYILLKPDTPWQREVLNLLDRACSLLQKYCLASEHYGQFPMLSFVHAGIESPCYELEVQTLLGQIWKIIYANRDAIPKIAVKKSNQILQVRMQKMLAFIQKNYATQISLEEISVSAGVSKSEAARCFEAYLHQSPGSYLLEYRLEVAQKMLLHEHYTIAEIAEKCGFSSSSYFCKIFKRELGMTPLQYRNKKI